jgi:hypothetical protein
MAKLAVSIAPEPGKTTEQQATEGLLALQGPRRVGKVLCPHHGDILGFQLAQPATAEGAEDHASLAFFRGDDLGPHPHLMDRFVLVKGSHQQVIVR